MLKKLQKSNGGFTIIEVVIVLAIAALILLIVLLAVPALQRNSRNTAIKNDASAVAGAVSTFASDNDGRVPTGIGGAAPTFNLTGPAGTSQAELRVQGNTNVVLIPTTGANPRNAAIQPGNISVWAAHRCDGTASNRAFAVWYSIETSNAVPAAAPFNNRCVDT